MQSSDTPAKISVPFANAGAKNTIPVPSQISVTPGAASFTDGFPPLTRTPLASGGVPPFGQDMNGVLFAITDIQQWQSAGGLFPWDSALSTAIGGYPKGAHVINATATGVWINQTENNTTNPDTGGAGWVSDSAYGVLALTGLTNANVTLTNAQAVNNRISLSGTLTGNIQIIVPNWTKDWTFLNSTTGAFSVTVKTAAGSGISLLGGGVPTILTCDGTNVIQQSYNIALATQVAQAMRLGQKPLTLLQAYTSGNNSPVVPAGVFGIYYKVWGAGGGGGGGSTAAQAGNAAGAGGYAEGWMAVTPGQTLTANVGTKGTGGAATGIAGTSGGVSTLSNGTITVTCNGGGNGAGGGTGGGIGGTATGGDFTAQGGNGVGPLLANAAGTQYYAPPGGASFGVGAAVSGYGNGAGTPGRAPGGGGAGGTGGSAGAFVGGDGANGAIYIWG